MTVMRDCRHAWLKAASSLRLIVLHDAINQSHFPALGLGVMHDASCNCRSKTYFGQMIP